MHFNLLFENELNAIKTIEIKIDSFKILKVLTKKIKKF